MFASASSHIHFSKVLSKFIVIRTPSTELSKYKDSEITKEVYTEQSEVEIIFNNKVRWLYSELISHISFYAKSHKNEMFVFSND